MAKSKKWVHLRGQYPTLPIDPKYTDVLVAMRDEHRGKTMSDLAAVYNATRQKREALDREVSDLNAKETALEHLMDDLLDRLGEESVTIGGWKFSRDTQPSVSTIDKAALLEWAMQHMRDNLQVHSSTLLAVVKDALENHKELPAGVAVNTYQTVKRLKA